MVDLIKTSSVVLYRDEEDNKIFLGYIYYPIKGAGNYVKREIIIDCENKTVKAICKHDTYSCGCGQLTAYHVNADLQLDEDKFNKLKNEVLNAKTLDDFHKISNTIHDMKTSLEEKIFDLVGELIEALQTVETTAKIREFLENKEEAKKEILDYLYEQLSDC